MSLDNKQLYVTRFLRSPSPAASRATTTASRGWSAASTSTRIADHRRLQAGRSDPAARAGDRLQHRSVSNTVVPDTDSTAFPNQLQSIVLRGTRGYLPNIAASPESPLQFQNSTQAYVNVIDGVGGASQTDVCRHLNLHLGARDPEAGKKKLFFANPWGIAFTTQSGVGNAYAISAGSDLLVKLNVDAARQSELHRRRTVPHATSTSTTRSIRRPAATMPARTREGS